MTAPLHVPGAVGAGAVRPAGSLDARLAAERTALQRWSVGALVAAVVAAAALTATFGTMLLGNGRWMTLPRLLPALVWISAAAMCVVVVRRVLRRDREALSAAALAGTIETEQGLRAGSLRGALEIARTGVLGERAAADVAGRLPAQTLAPALAARLLRTVAVVAVVALAAVGLASFAARTSSDGFAATLHPIRAFRGTLLPPLGFVRLPASVPRGMPLRVEIEASGRPTVTVSRQAAGEAARDTVLSVNAATGTAMLALGPVRAPVTLAVRDGRAPEARAVIDVADRGWIGDVALRAAYPAYLQRAGESLDPVAPLRVPRGTTVRVTATLRGGARDAALSNGVDTVRFAADGNAAAAEGAPVHALLTLDRDTRWTWIAASTPRAGGATLPPELPDALAFTVVPDRAPQVLIRAPVSDTTIGTTGVVPVIVSASDDHGVRAVSLSVWRERATGAAGARERVDVASPASPVFDGGATIALDGRDLQPGDRLHVVAIATDDSPWAQSIASPAVILRVPSLSEQRSMARSLADSLASKAAQIAAQERRLQQNTSDASRNREFKGDQSNGGQANGAGQSPKQMSYQTAEKTKQLAKDQQQLGAKVDSLRQSAKELEERLKSAGALDTALAARMRDVQRMLREAMTPEMQKGLQELEKNTDKLSGTQAQQSLEQLAAQQKQMRDQLEKSAEMLKRAALEGAMGTLRDEAKELAKAQQQLADQREGKRGESPRSGAQPTAGQRSDGQRGESPAEDPKALADRSRALEQEVERLAKRLEEAGAKPGAAKTKAAQPLVNQAADAMQRAAHAQQQQQQQQQQDAGEQNGGEKSGGQKSGHDEKRDAAADALTKALAGLKDEKDRPAPSAGQKADQQGEQKSGEAKGGPPQQNGEGPGQQKGQQADKPGGTKEGGQSGTRPGQGGQTGMPQPGQGPPQGGQQGQQAGQQGQQGGQQGQQGGNEAQRAASAMDKAAQQLSAAREAQVAEWKTELSQQLDQSINETMQLARQQAELEQKAKSQGAQGMQGEQGAVQQGVQQAAERLEKAGRSSSLLSQRSQKAMSEAQRRVQQATQAAGGAGQAGGQEQAQNAMKDATEALNQALSSLVRDRERVNSAGSASGFQEMMEQLKQLAQQQGSLNGQMQGLNVLPGGAKGQQGQQQARLLAKQQREVAKTLQDVSDADATGRTDALAKEAGALAQQMERSGVDPAVAARQQQLYRRLLDAGRFLEQDERDDQGPREAKSGGAAGRSVDGPQSGKAGSKYAPPTWNDLRGLGPEERRLVIEYFRRLNGTTP